MDEPIINLYFAGGTLLFNALMIWVVWSLKAGFVTKDVHQKLERRLTKAETIMDTIPSAQSFTELSLTIERIRGDVKGLGAHMDGFRDSFQNIRETQKRQEEYLLNNGGKR